MRNMWVVLVVSILGVFSLHHGVCGKPDVPCLYIFGDSLIDSGNNNNLKTRAKTNYPPYGIDFPKGPTGRFTNGKTTIDILGEFLGFDVIPPSENSTFEDLRICVNYASGSAGIRDETGHHYGENISMNRQLDKHLSTIARLSSSFGNETAAKMHLNSCLYYVGMGSNDYISNYYLPESYPTSGQYTPEQYAEVLIQQYSQQIKRLYKYGARKVALIGLQPLGCTPDAITRYKANDTLCADEMNHAAKLFNAKLKSLVEQFNRNLTDAKFTYINLFDIFPLSLLQPPPAGFKTIDLRCCHVENTGLCTPNQEPCSHRKINIFFDSFHPSETAHQIIAMAQYISLKLTDAYPYDIRTLVHL